MIDTKTLTRFYKQTNDKNEIKGKNSYDIFSVGPNLQQVLDILNCSMHLRETIYATEGCWSGDLYVAYKRLFTFMSDGGFSPGDKLAQVYEYVQDNTSGWTQYLSVILEGPFKEEIFKKFDDFGFAPKHSYLAKKDDIPNKNEDRGLWLNDIIRHDNLLPNYP